MNELAKAWIHDLAVYEPGRPIEELAREMGLDDATSIMKLASNENTLGPSPKAVEAMKAAATQMHLYPDGGAYYLRQALADQLGVDMDEVVVGSGSNELIVFLGHVYLEPGTNIVMGDCAFIVYKLVASAFQADTVMVPMKDHTHDLDAMLEAITPETRIVFISNPNNPTGTMVDEAALDAFMEKVPDHTVVVFDEAYIELLPPERQPNTLKYINRRPHVYVLRTFSKTYGLAGLRVGYGLAGKEDIDVLHHVRQPFNVNAMAQVAARAALKDEDHVLETRDMVTKGLAQLAEACDRLGIEYVPSVTNFMLIKVGDGRSVFEELQQRQIIVRPMNGYGLPDHVRVTIAGSAENARLIEELEALKEEGIIQS